MGTDQNNPATAPSFFIQEHSMMIRIWHWLTFIVISGIIITVLINSTIMNQRMNAGMVQEQLKSKGATVTEEQAFSVSREYEDKFWGIHKLLGYSLAFLLFSRIIIEITQPGEEKISSRFKSALGLYRLNNGERKVYRHYLGVKTGYLIFYILVVCMALTGLGLAFGRDLGFTRELSGTIREIHSFGQYLMYGFVILHLGGVMAGENREIRGIVSGMINGN
jgi:Ni/Fe-hydrogenase 1 B-type cytochrome subunit